GPYGRDVDETMAAGLFVTAPEGRREVREVSPAVNRLANDTVARLEPYGAEAVEPAMEPARKSRQATDSGQGSLF
ncbi:MAG: hypothetical protein WCG92_14160, partial [Hyphomicrobiales bacterium]